MRCEMVELEVWKTKIGKQKKYTFTYIEFITKKK